MFVAAWSFEMKYGTREETLRVLKEIRAAMQPLWKAKRTRILMGSIGAPESRVVLEHDYASLADLEASWEALHANGALFGKLISQMKNLVVDGTPRWEVYRIADES